MFLTSSTEALQEILSLITQILTAPSIARVSYADTYGVIYHYCLGHHERSKRLVLHEIPQAFARLFLLRQITHVRHHDDTAQLLHDVLLYPCRVHGISLNDLKTRLREAIIEACRPVPLLMRQQQGRGHM